MRVSISIVKLVLTLSRLAGHAEPQERPIPVHKSTTHCLSGLPRTRISSACICTKPASHMGHDLAGIPKSIVVQIQKQSVKSFLNLRVFLTIIKGELNKDSQRGVHEPQAHWKSSIMYHVQAHRLPTEAGAPNGVVQLPSRQCICPQTPLLQTECSCTYISEFSRHHSCILENKENTSPII